MDAEGLGGLKRGLTLACATSVELKAGRRSSARSVLVGLGAANGLPAGPLVSFGLAGGIADGLTCGDIVDADRVVDAAGDVLWQGAPLGVPGARVGTILAVDSVIDDPAERRRLHLATGALAVDMESGAIARAGRLVGCVRVISDTPDRPLDGLDGAVRSSGELDPVGLVRAFLRSPAGFARAAGDGRRALRVLERAAEAIQ